MTEPVREITADLVADLIARVAGEAVEVSPRRVGPGGVATATAYGVLRRAAVRRLDGAGDGASAQEPGEEPALVYEARLPADLDLTVEFAGRRYRFTAETILLVPVRVVVAGAVATVVLRPLTGRDVSSRLHAHGLQARVLARVGDVDGELRREVAAYVNQRMDDPDVRAAQRIPLAD